MKLLAFLLLCGSLLAQTKTPMSQIAVPPSTSTLIWITIPTSLIPQLASLDASLTLTRGPSGWVLGAQSKSTEIIGESPTRTDTRTLTLATAPVAGTVKLWVGGLRQSTQYFALAGSVVSLTFDVDPTTEILVDYQHQ